MKDLPARRYSEALLTLAIAEEKLEEYKSALLSIGTKLEAAPDVVRFLTSHFATRKEQYQVVTELAAPYPDLKFLLNFLRLLVKKQLFGRYKAIVRDFMKAANRELGLLDGIVWSSVPLSDDVIHRLEKSLAQKEGLQVELTNRLDPSLISGVRISIRDKVYDGSLKGRLAGLRHDLEEGGMSS